MVRLWRYKSTFGQAPDTDASGKAEPRSGPKPEKEERHGPRAFSVTWDAPKELATLFEKFLVPPKPEAVEGRTAPIRAWLADVKKRVPDIAAHRAVEAARAFHHWSRDAATRLAQGAAEYWTEESPLIASRVKVTSFGDEVAQLRDAVDRLAQRIARLG